MACAVVLAIAALLGGCQRSTSVEAGPTTTRPPLTVDELTARADRICLAARTRAAESGVVLDPALVPSAMEESERTPLVVSLTASVDIDRAAYYGLRALRVPDEVADRFDAYLETKRDRLVAADDAIAALALGDDAAYAAAMVDVASAEQRAGVQAVELGFVECSRS